jgi:hypothetical protein
MIQLRDDAQRVLKDTFPNGKFFNASSKPWWKFWSKDDVGLPPPEATDTPSTDKPWWKLW